MLDEAWRLVRAVESAKPRRPLLAKFPDSPGIEALQRVGPEIFVLPAGTLLWRIYRREGRSGEAFRRSWDAFRSYGPLRSARFDHHSEPPPGEGPGESERGIMYTAVGEHGHSGMATGGEAILTCVAEVFQQTRLADTSTGSPWLAAFAIEDDLPLLDLTGGWPTRAGASMQINSGPRPRARRWSRDAYEAYPEILGLYYPSSMYANQPAAALYERAKPLLPRSPSFHAPLSSPGLLPYLRSAVGAKLGYGLR